MRLDIETGGINAAKWRKTLRNANFWTRAAREWHRLYTPYVPMDTGRLLRDVRITPGQVEHRAPYARRVYAGSGIGFRRDKHPLAAARWDKAAQGAQKAALVRRLQALVDGGMLHLGR